MQGMAEMIVVQKLHRFKEQLLDHVPQKVSTSWLLSHTWTAFLI